MTAVDRAAFGAGPAERASRPSAELRRLVGVTRDAGRRWSRSALIPRAYWRPRHSAVLLVVLLAPLALAPLASGREGSTPASYGPILAVAAIGAAIASYVDWRLEPRRASAWRTVVAGMVGVPAVWAAAIPSINGPSGRGEPGSVTVLSLLCLALVVLAWCTIDRITEAADPLAVGLVTGTVLGATWIGASHLPSWEPAPLITAVLAAAYTTGMIAVVMIIRSQRELAGWAQNRFQSAIVLLGAASVAEATGGASAGVIAGTALVVLEPAAAALLGSTVVALLRQTVLEDCSRLCELRSRVEQLETRSRHGQATLHELKATVAGIAAANLVLRNRNTVSPQRARDLRSMVELEVSRLERLLQRPDGDDSPLEVVDLDQIIAPRVLAHEARGQEVHWQPTGHQAQARADDLAEVLNIALDNAAKHARSAARIDVHETADRIEIRIIDDGPGLPSDLRLFEWGARGPGSTGQGIGLHMAKRLAQRQGADLQVQRSDRDGTTVALLLHKAERRVRR